MAATANTEVERNGLGALAIDGQPPQPREATNLESEMNEPSSFHMGPPYGGGVKNPVLQSHDIASALVPPSPVMDVLVQIDNALGELRENALILAGRLAPVRRQAGNDAEVKTVRPPAGTSPYVMTLGGFYDRIRETTILLASVRDELEI